MSRSSTSASRRCVPPASAGNARAATGAEPGRAGASPNTGPPSRETGQSGPDGSPPNPAAAMSAAFDPNGWWNLLQSQFNQIASLAAASTAAGAAAAVDKAGK